MLIVGSKAILHHCTDFYRKSNDTDIVAYKSDLPKIEKIFNAEKVLNENSKYANEAIILKSDHGNIEVLLADEVESLQLMLDMSENFEQFDGLKYASLEMIFSMKKAHIHHPIKFEKHIKDYCWLGNKLSFKYDKKLMNLHRKCTNDRVGKVKTPRLVDKEVSEFFDQSKNFVKSFYVHDNIHKAVAHLDNGVPMYTKMQRDHNKAHCEKDLWLNFTDQEKQWCVMEEAYVIALERRILPNLFNDGINYNKLSAFKWALMRICTNLCSGWFRQYACDNYDKIMSQYDNNYVTKFFKEINKYDAN